MRIFNNIKVFIATELGTLENNKWVGFCPEVNITCVGCSPINALGNVLDAIELMSYSNLRYSPRVTKILKHPFRNRETQGFLGPGSNIDKAIENQKQFKYDLAYNLNDENASFIFDCKLSIQTYDGILRLSCYPLSSENGVPIPRTLSAAQPTFYQVSC